MLRCRVCAAGARCSMTPGERSGRSIADHPGHGRPRLPHRPAGPRAGCRVSRNGSSQLVPLALPGLRRLISWLIRPRPSRDHVLHWSHWRRRRQHQARVSHYKRRRHTPPEANEPSRQRPLQYRLIRFIERHHGVREDQITDWRHAVCGDLTSAFDFSQRNNDMPPLPGIRDCRPHAAKRTRSVTPVRREGPAPAGERPAPSPGPALRSGRRRPPGGRSAVHRVRQPG